MIKFLENIKKQFDSTGKLTIPVELTKEGWQIIVNDIAEDAIKDYKESFEYIKNESPIISKEETLKTIEIYELRQKLYSDSKKFSEFLNALVDDIRQLNDLGLRVNIVCDVKK